MTAAETREPARTAAGSQPGTDPAALAVLAIVWLILSLAIGLIASAHRLTPGPGEDKKPTVGLRIAALEIATKDQEDDVRRAQRALYLQRTARGTLNEDGQLELSQGTVQLLGESLTYTEAARLRAGLEHWTGEMTRVVNSSILTDGEIRHEVDRIQQGLMAVLHPARVTDDE